MTKGGLEPPKPTPWLRHWSLMLLQPSEVQSGSQFSDSEGECPSVTPAQRFLQANHSRKKWQLYLNLCMNNRGMTGWGKKHYGDIESAIAIIGLHLT